jgi:hypothetical protein
VRILVCGGRDFHDFWAVDNILSVYKPRLTWIIHGAAAGADALANEWAADNEIPTIRFPADWGRHGRSAGPIRNQQMIDEGKPDLVIALPGRRGTADMKARARKAGIAVIEVPKEKEKEAS